MMTRTDLLADSLLAATHDRQLTHISMREIAMLALLQSRQDVRWGTQELADALGISKPAVTRSVERLSAEGLATNTKRPRPHGRLRDIALTPAGALAVAKLASGYAVTQQSRAA